MIIGFFLAKIQIAKSDHPPYSPDLEVCGLQLFSKMKTVIIGVCLLHRPTKSTICKHGNKSFMIPFWEF